MTSTNPTEPIEFRMGALLSDIRSNLAPFSPQEQDAYLAEVKTLVEAGIAQARNDTFDLVRDVLKEEAETDRWEFLQYCLTGWVESGHTGFLLHEYDSGLSGHAILFTPGLPNWTERRKATATVIDQGDEDYDAEAVAMILATGNVCEVCGVALGHDGASPGGNYTCPRPPAGEHVPTKAVFEITHETIELGLQRIRLALDVPDTGTGNWERGLTSVPHLGQGLRNAVIRADLTNDSTQLDIWGYSAIVEIALFGEVRYA